LILVCVFLCNKSVQGVKNSDQRYKNTNQGKEWKFVFKPFVEPVSSQRKQHKYGYKLECKCAEFGVFTKGGALVLLLVVQWIVVAWPL
jgi:hypothetical protein